MAGTVDWNDNKARTNWLKHRVSFEEAATVFDDPFTLTRDDPDHSDVEDRLVTLGLSDFGRLLIVCHTDTGEIIRIISARAATPGERRGYERAT